MLEGIPAHDPARYTTTLITNGLALARDVPWLAATSLDRIKVSLHYLPVSWGPGVCDQLFVGRFGGGFLPGRWPVSCRVSAKNPAGAAPVVHGVAAAG